MSRKQCWWNHISEQLNFCSCPVCAHSDKRGSTCLVEAAAIDGACVATQQAKRDSIYFIIISRKKQRSLNVCILSVIHTLVEIVVFLGLPYISSSDEVKVWGFNWTSAASDLKNLTSSTWAWVCCKRLLLEPAPEPSGTMADLKIKS